MHKQLTKKEQQMLKKEFLYLETEEVSLFGVYCEEGFPVYYINKEAARLLGYDSVEELIEVTNGEVIQAIYWKDLSQVLRDIGTDYYEGRLFRSTHRMKRKDGSIFWAVYRGRMVRTDDGRIALLCMCTDMSRFIEQKEKLEHDKFISEAMLKNVPGGYHRCSGDEGYPLTYVSERFLEILGWTEQELEELFERKFLRLIHPDDRYLADAYISRLAASGSGQKYQEQIYRLKGKEGYRWVTDTTMQMEIDGEFFYQGFISDITDFITEQEQREKKLARLERERQQNEVFAALGKIYHAIFQIDLETDSYQEIFCRDDVKAYYDYAEHSARKVLGQLCEKVVAQKDAKRMHSFFNLSTMAQRLADCEFVEAECITQYGNWHRARLIAQRRNEMGCVTQVLYVTQVIDDEKQYEAHLVAKAAHADYANQSKTTFISQVAHDIWTPLNSIFGFLEIAEANAEDAQKVRYSLDKIRNAGAFLKALVSDVLDIAKMEDGRMTLQPEEVSLTQLAEEFAVAMQNTRPDKQQIFRMNVQNICHDWILANPLRLKQIYTNVAANAIKYTPNGGIIDCCICQEEMPGTDLVRIVTTISDTGIGMSDAFMEKMFTKFERETDTRINKISGYGLGLPIVKELVDLMGGTIEVQSCVGEGTTFCICLEVPYVKRHEAEEAETQIDYSAACAGMHLLVAEDNVLNREVITELLAMHDITCTCAGDGAVCLRCLKTAPQGTYDAILMDVQMPVMNGIDATKQIRALPYAWAEKIPIIAMTANAMKDDVQICMEAGMNRHLSKPIEMELLLKTLAEVKRGV